MFTILNYQLDSGGIIAMDGAMGTEIHNRGIKLDPLTWSAEALSTETGQAVISGIHADSIAAGAKVIITNTFRTDWLGKSSAKAALLACKLARRAREQAEAYNVAIAGSVGPVGDCYKPEATPSEKVLISRHKEQIAWLKQGGVDYILAETMPTIQEAVTIAEIATAAGLPVGISFCCKHHNGKFLLSREPLESAVQAIVAIKGINLVSIGVNCVTPQTATQAVKCLTKMTIPGNPLISVYAQGIDESSPVSDDNIIDPYENYLEQVDKWLDAGARLIGGCCGVPPSWIETIAQKIADRQSLPLFDSAIQTNLSSAPVFTVD